MFGSQTIPVFCHMGNFGCGDGGWTLAMKIAGTQVNSLSPCETLDIIEMNISKSKLQFLSFRELSITIPNSGATEVPSQGSVTQKRRSTENVTSFMFFLFFLSRAYCSLRLAHLSARVKNMKNDASFYKVTRNSRALTIFIVNN